MLVRVIPSRKALLVVAIPWALAAPVPDIDLPAFEPPIQFVNKGLERTLIKPLERDNYPSTVIYPSIVPPSELFNKGLQREFVEGDGLNSYPVTVTYSAIVPPSQFKQKFERKFQVDREINVYPEPVVVAVYPSYLEPVKLTAKGLGRDFIVVQDLDEYPVTPPSFAPLPAFLEPVQHKWKIDRKFIGESQLARIIGVIVDLDGNITIESVTPVIKYSSATPLIEITSATTKITIT